MATGGDFQMAIDRCGSCHHVLRDTKRWGLVWVNWRRILGWTVAVVVLFIGASGCGSSPAVSHHRTADAGPPPTAPPTELTGPDVVTLQMFTATSGVGVASAAPPKECPGCSDESKGPYYFVTTADGGSHWSVVSPLPAGTEDGYYGEINLKFATPSIGYLGYGAANAGDAKTLFTTDGGRTWSSVQTGIRTSADDQSDIGTLAGGILWNVVSSCPKGTTRGPSCQSLLAAYQPGPSVPVSRAVIPIPTGVDAAVGSDDQARLIGRIDATTGLVSEGGEGGPTSLQITHDTGQHWAAVVNPCGQLTPLGFVAASPSRWWLYCNQGSGNNSGIVAFYTTADGGQNWQVLAQGSEGSPAAATIGPDLGYDLTTLAGNQVFLLVGEVVGLQVSADGGAHWKDIYIQTGGAHAHIAVAPGTTDAWLPTPTGLYHTADGINWKPI